MHVSFLSENTMTYMPSLDTLVAPTILVWKGTLKLHMLAKKQVYGLCNTYKNNKKVEFFIFHTHISKQTSRLEVV